MKPQSPVSPAGLTVMFMLPFVRSRHSNSAQDLRESDFLLNLPQDPKVPLSDYKLVDWNNVTGVHRFILGNGIGVNVRSIPEEEVIKKGEVQLQVVALGGLATQMSGLKVCYFSLKPLTAVHSNALSNCSDRVPASLSTPSKRTDSPSPKFNVARTIQMTQRSI